MKPGKIVVASLAAWLERHQGEQPVLTVCVKGLHAG
jgi:hypothetical protein